MKILSISQMIFSSLTVLIVGGCGGGGGGSSPALPQLTTGSLAMGSDYSASDTTATTHDYYVTVSDDPILGARLKATKKLTDTYGITLERQVCESFTELGKGLYALNRCSQKPEFIEAIGGYNDKNLNGQLDSDEPTQNSPLRLFTGILTDTNLTMTPLTTLAADYVTTNGYNLDTFATKLGFGSRVEAFRATTQNQELNRYINALLNALDDQGIDRQTFLIDFVTRILNSSGTGIQAVQNGLTNLLGDTQSDSLYGHNSLQALQHDQRVIALNSRIDPMQAMISYKTASNMLTLVGRCETLPYGASTNGLANASIEAYQGMQRLGQMNSDAYGNFRLSLPSTAFVNGAKLYLKATVGNYVLTSTIATDTLLAKQINGTVTPHAVGNLVISFVSTFFNDNNNTIQKTATLQPLLFDSTSYKDKNLSNRSNFIPLTILYEDHLLPGGVNNEVNTTYLKELATTLPSSNIPYILDIEHLPLPYEISSANDVIVKASVAKYVQVISTLKSARPDLKFGYFGMFPSISPYGPGTITDTMEAQAQHLFDLTLPVIQAEDFVAPGLYTSWEDPTIYIRLMTKLLTAADQYQKPLLPYLWPEYMDDTAMKGQMIPESYWVQEIQLAKAHSKGLAIWGGYDFLHQVTRSWDEQATWWKRLKSDFLGL